MIPHGQINTVLLLLTSSPCPVYNQRSLTVSDSAPASTLVSLYPVENVLATCPVRLLSVNVPYQGAVWQSAPVSGRHRILTGKVWKWTVQKSVSVCLMRAWRQHCSSHFFHMLKKKKVWQTRVEGRSECHLRTQVNTVALHCKVSGSECIIWIFLHIFDVSGIADNLTILGYRAQIWTRASGVFGSGQSYLGMV